MYSSLLYIYIFIFQTQARWKNKIFACGCSLKESMNYWAKRKKSIGCCNGIHREIIIANIAEWREKKKRNVPSCNSLCQYDAHVVHSMHTYKGHKPYTMQFFLKYIAHNNNNIMHIILAKPKPKPVVDHHRKLPLQWTQTYTIPFRTYIHISICSLCFLLRVSFTNTFTSQSVRHTTIWFQL